MLRDILAEIFPLHRTLSSEGSDRAFDILSKYVPKEARFTVEEYEALKRVWSWFVPMRYDVQYAYLDNEDGRVLDFKSNPLHLVSYSMPIDRVMSWSELEPHLYYHNTLPDAIPWHFQYYEPDWGFCLSKNLYDSLPRDKKYHAVIVPEKNDHGMRVASAFVGMENNPAGELLVMAHICHPAQANDDAAGVVTALELISRLTVNPLPAGSMSVRFLFAPETIGSIAYLAHHEDLIPNLRGGIFIEMTGNNNSLILQHSRDENSLINRIARHGWRFREGAFGKVVANDERTLESPGVNVPCISISRWPYPEYHTSADNLDIIHEDKLQGAADEIEKIIRIFASNYTPKQTVPGPLFLSGNGLWVDWRKNWELNRAIEQIMLCFDGNHSIFDIAEKVGLDYWTVFEYVEKFRQKGLVIPIETLSTAQSAEVRNDKEI